MKLNFRNLFQVVKIPFRTGTKADRQQGMSLIEIILVISLMATLMGILITNLTGQQDEALKDSAKLAMQQLSQKLQQFRIHNYRYPTTAQGLDALINNPGNKKWRGPYVEKKELLDPWGNTFGYESDGNTYKIISGGIDGQVGNEDDVSFPEDASGTTEEAPN